MGIWIPRGDMDYASEQEPESEEEEVDDNGNENEHSTGSEGSELDGDAESDEGRKVAGVGRFDALATNETDEEQDESDG